jgi:hypothetical protein
MSIESTIYRIITGGEDGNICFWRYERKENPHFEMPHLSAN